MNQSDVKIEWRVLTATASEPAGFARELQDALQKLTDEGFSIVSQLMREGVMVITGQRVVLPSRAVPVEAPIPQSRSLARRWASAPTKEALYHYREMGEQKQVKFSSLENALHMFGEHMQQYALLGSPIPINVTLVSMRQLDPPELASMLAALEPTTKRPG